jgi:integrase
MQYVKYPKYEHSKAEIDRKVITSKEFETIIERFHFGTSFYIPLMIGYHTGCRIGEVMSLTWDDIDLKERIIDVNKSLVKRDKNWYFGSTKTKSSVRKIKFGKTLGDHLKKYRKWQMENKLKYGQHSIQQYEVEEMDPETGKKLRRIHSLQSSIDPGVMQSINMVCTKEDGDMVTPETFKYASRVIHYQLGSFSTSIHLDTPMQQL